MDKKKIVSMVKSQEEEKVPFSLKLPVSLKAEIQALSESESISMNSLIVATLQSLIDDDCGKELTYAKKLLNEANSVLVHLIPSEYEMQEILINADQFPNAGSKQQIEIITNRKNLKSNISAFLAIKD